MKIMSDGRSKKRGVTILEIMLSLLILGGCAAAIGGLFRNALRNAGEARDLVQAELLAESLLAKVRIGIIDMESAYDVPVSDPAARNDTISDTNVVSRSGDALWLYSLEVNDIDADYGLLEIALTVRQNLPEENRPVRCRLVRWFALEPEEDDSEN